jgi:hypothetical protein
MSGCRNPSLVCAIQGKPAAPYRGDKINSYAVAGMILSRPFKCTRATSLEQRGDRKNREETMAAMFVSVVAALAPLKLDPEIFANVISAIAPVLLETPQTARANQATKERKKPSKKRGTGKGQQWRIDAARKGAETRRQQKEAAAARSGETLKSRPRSKDARLQPVIALLREKAAEGRSHAMTDLERECRIRSIDAGLLDEAVRHLGGHLSRNGGNVLHAELPAESP